MKFPTCGNAREQGMDAAARTEHRQTNAVPMLTVVKKYGDSLIDQEVLPKSDLAGALGYLRNHWEALSGLSRRGKPLQGRLQAAYPSPPHHRRQAQKPTGSLAQRAAPSPVCRGRLRRNAQSTDRFAVI